MVFLRALHKYEDKKTVDCGDFLTDSTAEMIISGYEVLLHVGEKEASRTAALAPFLVCFMKLLNSKAQKRYRFGACAEPRHSTHDSTHNH